MSRFSSFIAKAFRWLIGAAFVLGLLLLPLHVARWFVISTGCFTEVLAEVPNISGFDFEVSETDCWHSPAISVYVSKPGRTKKTRLLQYDRGRYTTNANPVPIITSIGEHAVQISLSSVGPIDCCRDRWKTLTVRYDIGVVVDPDPTAQMPEC
jgi:hypothetical protein